MITERRHAQHQPAAPGARRGYDDAARSESRRISAELESRIDAAAAGDVAATGEMLRLINPLVQRYCRARMGNTAHLQMTVDDVAQEILLATVQAIPRYRDQGKSFLAFVYGISANKVADAFRHSRQNRVYPTANVPDMPSPAAGPEEWALAAERSGIAGELLRTLTPAHREVLVMRLILGWTAAQTAEAIGTSPGVVRVMQHRALNKLRARVREIS